MIDEEYETYGRCIFCGSDRKIYHPGHFVVCRGCIPDSDARTHFPIPFKEWGR